MPFYLVQKKSESETKLKILQNPRSAILRKKQKI